MADKDLWRTVEKKDGSLEFKTFESYDKVSAKKELKLEDKAHAFATADPENIDERELTDQEKKIVGHTNDYIYKLNDWYSVGVGQIKKFINKRSTDANPELNFEIIRREFDGKFRQFFDDFQHDLERCYKELRNALLQLNSFRETNKIGKRPAIYPPSIYFHLSIVVLLIFVEAVANSYFFAKGSDLGLLGGWFNAALVSVGNIVLSLPLAGFLFLRECNHKARARKIIGVVGFVGCLVVIAFLHLATAHYRELLIRNPNADLVSALAPAMNNPFGLHDFESFILIIIGVGISTVAIFEGYKLDDPYPGYGDVYRRWQRLDERMAGLKKKLKEQIGLAYDDAVSESYELLEKLKEKRKELENETGDIESFFNRFEGRYNQARNSASDMIKEFRIIVRNILDDQNRFPFDEGMLAGEGGVKDLGIYHKHSEVISLLNDNIRKIKTFIDEYPDSQRDFIGQLEKDRLTKTSTENIENLIALAQEKAQEEEKTIG